LNYIAAAYDGYCETLESIFGTSDNTTNEVSRGADGAPIELTPNVFDIQFGGNDNRQVRWKH
jgi:hypothetical protein